MLAQGGCAVSATSRRASWRREVAGTALLPVAGVALGTRPRRALCPPQGGGGFGGGEAPPIWSQAACSGRDRTRPPSTAARRGRSPRAPLAGDGRRPGAAAAGSAAPYFEYRGAEPGGERARTGRASLFAAVRRGRAIPPGEHRRQTASVQPGLPASWLASGTGRGLVIAAAPSRGPVCGGRSGRRSPEPAGRSADAVDRVAAVGAKPHAPFRGPVCGVRRSRRGDRRASVDRVALVGARPLAPFPRSWLARLESRGWRS